MTRGGRRPGPDEAAQVPHALPEIGSTAAAVLAASPNAIIAVDAAGYVSYANPRVESTFGYLPEELVGQPLTLIVPESLLASHHGQMLEFFSNPVPRPMGTRADLAGRHREGHEFPVEISLAPVETEAGLQVFATVVDISARKIQESELLQAQKLESVGRLAGGIAHDFNNILFAISGYSELLEEDLGGEAGELDRPTTLLSIKAIGDAARRGASLTSQLLSFSRQQVVSARIIDIDDAIRSVEPMLRPLIGESLEFQLRLQASGARVKIDPGQFDQIVVNLVVNARDAMPDGGTLAIYTNKVKLDDPFSDGHAKLPAGRYAVVVVSDTGVGMDPTTQEHAFEPFFTTKARGKGTGLGLATSYGIVRQAGGHIWLYSVPGRGSLFRVYLPLVGGPAAAERPTVDAPSTSAGGRALVVEDEPAVRDVTTRMLERAGYSVVAVSNGAEALAAADDNSGPIDVLVTDLVMPGMSGLELADSFNERYPNAAVVILSGYTAETLDVERAIAKGTRFVGKPVSSRTLVAAIAAAVADHVRRG